MNTVWVFLVTVCASVAVSVQGQEPPCSPKDPGPFLATPPTLSMDVYEASAQDLSSNPDKYRAELRLNGEVGGQGSEGIVVEVMPDYQFMNPEDSFRFVADGATNYLQMYKALDRDGPTTALDDDTNVFSFTLKCSLQSNMSDFVYYDARIFVLDVNDNDPYFLNLTTTLTLNELTPLGLTVLKLRAEDLDLNSNLTYSIVPATNLADDMSGYFEVDPVTGELALKDQLDYETMAEGTLVVSVQDGGSPARTATATIGVMVEDGDDQGPVFVYPGCWTYKARCSWPKYTTSTSITQGQPISVLPVPNKVQTNVVIKAKDLDLTANPVSFHIASTIPPGSESMFSVTTKQTGKGEYAAIITPTTTTTLTHGFEIFLEAEEQSEQKRFEVAMIFFEDPNHVCSSASGTSFAQTQPDKGNQNTDDTTKDDEKYSEPIIALIVVVAILAAFVFCLAIAFFCVLRRSPTSRNTDVTLTRM